MMVAIQGVQGSFHYKVTQSYFNEGVVVAERDSFVMLMNTLISGQATDAIMPMENAISGAIVPRDTLLDQQQLHIEGSYYLDIQHNLMPLSDQHIQDIKEVGSYPIELLQCRKYFKQFTNIKPAEDTDTAGVARQIREEGLKGIEAIAGIIKALIYNLQILSQSIQTIKEKATLFFVLNTKRNHTHTSADKVSLCFKTDYRRGNFATIFNVMSDCKLILKKIESMPIIKTPWEYNFFVDVTFQNYVKAKKVLLTMVTDFKGPGEYKNHSES